MATAARASAAQRSGDDVRPSTAPGALTTPLIRGAPCWRRHNRRGFGAAAAAPCGCLRLLFFSWSGLAVGPARAPIQRLGAVPRQVRCSDSLWVHAAARAAPQAPLRSVPQHARASIPRSACRWRHLRYAQDTAVAARRAACGQVAPTSAGPCVAAGYAGGAEGADRIGAPEPELRAQSPARRLRGGSSSPAVSQLHSVALEVLHRALVLFGRGARAESPQIASPLGAWVDLARIQAIFTGA